MTLARLILRSLYRRTSLTTTISATVNTKSLSLHPQPRNPTTLIPFRSFAFSSAEEAAAERRRRKRRLRIEPPLHALQRDPNAPRPRRDPNQPDTTSALVGERLALHNRVQSLIRAGDLDNASVVARQSVFSSTRPTVFTCNAIIGSMYRAQRYTDAIALFIYFFRQCNIVPNVVSYNFLIISHCENGEVDKALEVYQHIKENAPFSPSAVTFRHLTKGLIDAKRIDDAVNLLWKMVNDGHGADSHVFNNVILGYLNLDNLEKANEFFDELKSRCMVFDGIVSATFMEWFFSKGRPKEAMESYKSLLDREFKMVPATCNVLLEVLLKWGKKAEAEALFNSMLDRHTPPVVQAVNSDTFNLMVNESFKEGKGADAYGVFKKAGTAPKSKPFAMDTAGFNNIIKRYCEVDMVDDAEKMYMELRGKSLSADVNTFKALIDAYFKAGRVDEALDKYTEMVENGLRVIPTYANKWFTELIENGKIVECEPILTKMAERDPKPDATTYDIVIRAFCEASDYETGLKLVQQMIGNGVGVGPVLKEYVLDVFEKVGRKEEIERVLNARFPSYAANTSASFRNAQQHGGGNLNGFRQQPENVLHGNGNVQRQQYGYAQQNGNSNDNVNRQHYNISNAHLFENRSGQPNTGNGSGQQNTGNESGQQDTGHGSGQQNTGSYNGSGQQNTGSYYGSGPQNTGTYNVSGQHYNNGSYNGSGQQNTGSYNVSGQQNTGSYNVSGQQNTGSYNASGQLYNNGSYNGSGLQNTGSYNGSGYQYNTRSYNGNGQQYNNGSWNGNGQQYNNGSFGAGDQQYNNRGYGQHYNNGSYNGNGEQYGNLHQNGTEQPDAVSGAI
ncbi:pentatricopeptide repeat-containing protein At1g10270-like [Rutidosis leptorrhynchoides]|uniref:pentatricopeptide repeat-containing protein At1g10270-like n=1 Tax=Rutidosis leptorrhynchoides TaxID=125765 RepID=UPI003A98F6A4